MTQCRGTLADQLQHTAQVQALACDLGLDFDNVEQYGRIQRDSIHVFPGSKYHKSSRPSVAYSHLIDK
jgi:hypothetical protein